MLRKTMQAAVVQTLGRPLRIEAVPIPEIRPDQVLIKVDACGITRTDLHAADGELPLQPKVPFIPGHAAVGHVVEVGQQVSTYREGDRVGMSWLYSACGNCEWCLRGWETVCPSAQFSGFSLNGGCAEYVAAPARYLARIPVVLSPGEAATILCAGGTAYKGLRETEAHPDQWVCIVGINGLGQVAIQYAHALGLKVAAVDVTEEKLERARQFGVRLLINAGEPNAVEELGAGTDGGAHGVLVTSLSPPLFRQAMAMTRRRGTCVLLGLRPGDYPLPVFDLVMKRISVRGSLTGTRADLREALCLAAAHNIAAEVDAVPLAGINEAFGRLRQGEIHGHLVIDLDWAAKATAA